MKMELSASMGMSIMLAFGAFMLAITLFSRKSKVSLNSFLLADRKLGWVQGAFSIAASWIWAPALFVSVQVSYEMGVAGLFWFTAPNVLALLLFALWGPRIRELFAEGVTLPQFIGSRLGSERVRRLYLFPSVFYQLMAVAVQLFAGGHFVQVLTGLPLQIVMPVFLLTTLSYTLLSGLRISAMTDFLQLGMILLVGAVILPLTLHSAGGFDVVLSGLRGLQDVPIYDASTAFSFGVVTSIGLIAGALSDQQYWQRVFALKPQDVQKAFVFGAGLFALIPLGLSLLAFIAVANAYEVPIGLDQSMIGVQTVRMLLPEWAVVLFFIALFAGLSSTLDSAFSAVSSLWATDIHPKGSLTGARIAMLVLALLGWLVSVLVSQIPGFGLQHLWWVFNTIAACTAGPTVLVLYAKKPSEKGIFGGILVAFLFGLPFFIWANIQGETVWIVSSAVFVVMVSTGSSICRSS